MYTVIKSLAEGKTHRLMQQNRECRNRPTQNAHLNTNQGANATKWSIVLLTNGAGATGHSEAENPSTKLLTILT